MDVGLIGYGKMGSAILRLLVAAPHKVTVLMRDKEKACQAEALLYKKIERSFKRLKRSKEEISEKKDSLKFTHKIEDIRSADVVIETITEDFKDKVSLLKQVEMVVKKPTIITTNTSSLSVRELARGLVDNTRFCGLHFFHPVPLIDLVEIIKHDNTSQATLAGLLQMCEGLGKHPITVQDTPGSLINMILAHYYLEAIILLEEGLAPPSKIDALAKEYFYIGPCESIDVVGIDFLAEAFGRVMPIHADGINSEEYFSSEERQPHNDLFKPRMPYLFAKLLADKRFGKKCSKGIYLYKGEKPYDDVIEYYNRKSCVTAGAADEEIKKRLLFSIFRGCLRSKNMQLASREDIDTGVRSILHMKEGPFAMMKSMGRKKVEEDFASLAGKAGKHFETVDYGELDWL